MHEAYGEDINQHREETSALTHTHTAGLSRGEWFMGQCKVLSHTPILLVCLEVSGSWVIVRWNNLHTYKTFLGKKYNYDAHT